MTDPVEFGTNNRALLTTTFGILTKKMQTIDNDGLRNYVTNNNGMTTQYWATTSSASINMVATDTAAEIPSYPYLTRALKIVNGGTGTEYVYFQFQLGNTDLNRTFQIGFDYLTGGGYTTGDFRLEIWADNNPQFSSPLQIALASDSGGTTPLASGTSYFSTAFTTTTDNYIQFRIKRNTGAANHFLSLNGIFCGPITYASSTSGGGVSPGDQTFTGEKEFLNGLRNRWNINTGTGPFTLTSSDNPFQTYTNVTAPTVNLPTTNIKSGAYYWLKNTSDTNDMTVKASDGTTVGLIRGGWIVLEATQDTPTSNAHWRIVQANEQYSATSTTTPTGWTGSITQHAIVRRNNKTICVEFNFDGTLTRSSATTASFNVLATFARYDSTNQQGVIAQAAVNGSYAPVSLGIIPSSGTTIEIYKTTSRGSFSGADTLQTFVAIPLTWNIA